MENKLLKQILKARKEIEANTKRGGISNRFLSINDLILIEKMEKHENEKLYKGQKSD